MKKLALVLAFLIGSVASAFATCTGPAVMHDFPGTSFNMSLATVPDGNCGSNVALPTWAGGTLGAMANYGTSPGAVLVPGVNAFITNTPSVQGAVSNASSGVATGSTNVPTVSYLYGWNGTTWDQLVKTSNGLKTDGSAVTQPASAAASQFVDGWDVTQGAKADAAYAGSGSASEIAVLKGIYAAATAPANLAAAATGGCTGGVILSAASNNSTNIKASAGTLCELVILQTTTTLMDVRLYDTASAPTCSSATGIVANYVVQSNATSPGMTIPLGPFGKAFANGIGICITGANSNTDNTNAATGLNVNYAFK